MVLVLEGYFLLFTYGRVCVAGNGYIRWLPVCHPMDGYKEKKKRKEIKKGGTEDRFIIDITLNKFDRPL